MAEAAKHKVLRLRDVQAITGLGRSAVYEGMAEGTFPSNIPLSAKAVGWVEAEIQLWIERRITARDKANSERHAERST